MTTTTTPTPRHRAPIRCKTNEGAGFVGVVPVDGTVLLAATTEIETASSACWLRPLRWSVAECRRLPPPLLPPASMPPKPFRRLRVRRRETAGVILLLTRVLLLAGHSPWRFGAGSNEPTTTDDGNNNRTIAIAMHSFSAVVVGDHQRQRQRQHHPRRASTSFSTSETKKEKSLPPNDEQNDRPTKCWRSCGPPGFPFPEPSS
mmetsp:Transcript_22392/g.48729  ORF Transcript_22392/g.48729 Transcript_22392/m.48729 type:complete len:203 (-) Transcript_22392:53-661(-)